MRKLLVVLLLIFASQLLPAQNVTFYGMNSDAYSRSVKPQAMPETKYFLYVPVISSFNFEYGNNSFAYHDLIKRRSDDSLIFRLDNVLSKMKENNFIGLDISTTLLGFGFRENDNYFEFTINERFSVGFNYPKQLINLLDKGNAPFIGQTLEFTNTSLDLSHFREYSFGFSRKFSSRFTGGGNFKILYGLENISTSNKSIRFNTRAEDYALMLNSDVSINTSSYNNSTNGYKDYKPGKYFFGGLHNKGIAFDFGGSYQVNDQWTANLSVLDLGFIHWKSNVRNYQTAQGTYTFNGVDLSDFINDTTRNVQSILDSLSGAYKTSETSDEYSTSLHSTIIASAGYKVNDRTTLAGIVRIPFFYGTIHPSIGIAANQKLSSKTALTVSYSYQNRSLDNLGLGFQLNAGALHAFAATDNIFGFFAPTSFRTVGLRVGFGFAFGATSETNAE